MQPILRLLIERVRVTSAGVEVVWRDAGFVDLAAEFVDAPLLAEHAAMEAA